MTISKKIKIFSVVSVIITIVLYSCILFMKLDVVEFDQLALVLSTAQMFLALSCVLILFVALTTRFTYSQRKIRLSVIIVCLLSVVFFGGKTILNYNSVYSCYVPDLSIKENLNFIQGFFPYNRISETQDSIDIETSVMFGTKRIIVSSWGDSSVDGVVNYTVDYFQSISPFMNLKFYFDKGIILSSDLIYVDAYTHQEKIEVNEEKITLFTKDNSSDYGLFIRKGNKAVYAEVNNIYNSGVSYEEFAKDMINQFEVFEKTAKDGSLLEIPEK